MRLWNNFSVNTEHPLLWKAEIAQIGALRLEKREERLKNIWAIRPSKKQIMTDKERG